LQRKPDKILCCCRRHLKTLLIWKLWRCVEQRLAMTSSYRKVQSDYVRKSWTATPCGKKKKLKVGNDLSASNRNADSISDFWRWIFHWEWATTPHITASVLISIEQVLPEIGFMSTKIRWLKRGYDKDVVHTGEREETGEPWNSFKTVFHLKSWQMPPRI
jgi:hypothetical protein